MLGTIIFGCKKWTRLIGQLRYLAGVTTAFPAALASEAGLLWDYEVALGQDPVDRTVGNHDAQILEGVGP